MVIGLAVAIGSIISASAEDRVILSIKSPSDGATVHSNKITVSGTATAKGVQYIESVTVIGNPADGKDKWSADILLNEGNNSIEVVATTDTGQYNSTTITVNYQPTPPPTQPPRYDGAPSAIPTPTPKLTVSISITSIPSVAKVYLDDFYKGITPTLVNVTEGSHKIEVTKEGYDIYSETKKICLGDGEPEEMIIELEPLTNSIHVFSTPSGASVYLDNVSKIDTNCTLSEVAVGQHTITLKKSGYCDVIKNVSVPVGKALELHENLIECIHGSIDISSDPSGAKVYLDNVYTKDTQCMLSEVVVGNHTIKLTKLHYDDVIIRNLTLSVGETCHLHVNMTGYGSLSISSYPSGARVYLDGIYKNDTPCRLSKVIEGWHTYKLIITGYDPVEKNIDVSAGEWIEEDVTLAIPEWGKTLIEGGVVLAMFIGTLKFVLIPVIRSMLKKKELKKVFADEKQPLSPEAKVSKIDEKHWEIIDGKTQYRIEDTGLGIYKKKNQ